VYLSFGVSQLETLDFPGRGFGKCFGKNNRPRVFVDVVVFSQFFMGSAVVFTKLFSGHCQLDLMKMKAPASAPVAPVMMMPPAA